MPGNGLLTKVRLSPVPKVETLSKGVGPTVCAGVGRRERFHLHFTPTSASGSTPSKAGFPSWSVAPSTETPSPALHSCDRKSEDISECTIKT